MDLTKSTTVEVKRIVFFRNNERFADKIAKIKKRKDEETRYIDFVIKAWEKLDQDMPDDPLKAFVFRSHLPHERPVGVLTIHLAGELAK